MNAFKPAPRLAIFGGAVLSCGLVLWIAGLIAELSPNANANWQLWTFLLVSVGAACLLLANAKRGEDRHADVQADAELAIGPVRWLLQPISPAAHVGPRLPERHATHAIYALAYLMFVPIRAIFRLLMLLLFPPPRIGDVVSIALPGATARFAIIVVESATETQLSTRIVHESESRKRAFRFRNEDILDASYEIAIDEWKACDPRFVWRTRGEALLVADDA